VIAAGKVTNGLLQVVRGSLRVELEQADRPENLSVGQLQPGEMLGVRTQLLGAVPTVYTVVCEAEEALLLHFTSEYLDFVFDSNPALGAKFYCVLAMRQAAKLARLCQKDANQLEKVISDTQAIAPKGIEEITASPAFFHILQRFAYQAVDVAEQVPVAVDFMHDVFQLHGEANAMMLRVMVDRLHALHVAPDADRPIECLSAQLRSQLTELLKGLHSIEAKELRHIFDIPLAACKKFVEDAAFKSFQQSQHYQYVLALKSKELTVPKIEYFKVLNLLGRGSFGEVVEVVKRDCGQMYAMKVQRKELLQNMFGEVWEQIVMTERTLLVNLRHPLLINLAYAFQSIDHLVLVMDLCPLGDMTPFAAPLESRNPSKTVRMSMECVRFVALEVAACLLYVHSRAVLYRDLKPENLLIDMYGHCRLVDFGAAKQGDPESGVPPTSSEYTGTPVYMAPEVKLIDELGKPYGAAVDWFSYGVIIYEFAEQALPFGPNPQFMNCDDEFIPPKLRDESGVEVPHLFDFLASLLDWDPSSRLDGSGVVAHPYLKGADWEIVGLARLKSPLLPIVAYSREFDEFSETSLTAELSMSAAKFAEKSMASAVRAEGSSVHKEAMAKAVAIVNAEQHLRPGQFKNTQGRMVKPSKNTFMRMTESVGKEAEALASELAKAQQETEKAEAAQKRPSFDEGADAFLSSMSNGAVRANTKEEDQLAERELEMYVEGWDYSSSHALAREYIMGAQNIVSSV